MARYNGRGGPWDEPSAVAVSPDGSRVFVTGSSQDAGTYPDWEDRNPLLDYVTVAYDSVTGRPLWEARYKGPEDEDDVPTALSVSPDGNRLFVTGSSFAGYVDDEPHHYPTYDYATVAYDTSDGSELWVARYDGTGSDDGASSIAINPDGSRVFVSGSSWGGGSQADYGTIAYDASDGREMWVARYEGTNSGWDIAESLAMSSDGQRIFVTGSTAVDWAWDYATVAYDAANGTELWEDIYASAGEEDHARSISVHPDGSTVYVTGGTRMPQGFYGFGTIAYDATDGRRRWVALYDGDGHGGSAVDLAIAHDGSRLFVLGSSGRSGSILPDYATVAYDSRSGEPLWVARYDHNQDEPESIAVTADDSAVVVTGSSTSVFPEGTGWDFATVSYDTADGAQLWTARFNDAQGIPQDWATNHNFATALALAPNDLRVYVTGSSYEGAPAGSGYTAVAAAGSDYTTVGYDPTPCSYGQESGPISQLVHRRLEPLAESGSSILHDVNCNVVSRAGL